MRLKVLGKNSLLESSKTSYKNSYLVASYLQRFPKGLALYLLGKAGGNSLIYGKANEMRSLVACRV